MAAKTPVPAGCLRHEGLEFLYVCKSCEDVLVCMECVTDSHNGHTLGKLTDYVADQKREIQQYADKLSKIHISKTEGDIMPGKLLVDGVDESYTPIPKCVAMYEFKANVQYDTCQTCLTGKQAWLSYSDRKTIHRVDVKGKANVKIDCQFNVRSISVSPTTGRVLFCVLNDKSIREIMTDDDIVDIVKRFNVDNTPYSLCITSDDMVVVGMKRGIQQYTTDGRAVSAGEGGPGKQVAVYPHHMTSCTLTGDVAAVDSDNVSFDDYMAGKKPSKQPHVIVMDKHLKRKFCCKDIGTRKTHGSDIQSSKFYPYDVCFDGAGDVLVTEFVTKSVLLIDRNTGNYMRTVYTSDEGPPRCISLRNDGTLWVGHRDGKTTKVIEYK